MLDGFEVLTTSGVVLFSKKWTNYSPNLINSLIRDVFIEDNHDRSAPPNLYRKDKHALHWVEAKGISVIFVALYQSIIHISWVKKFLDDVRNIFTTLYQDQFKRPHSSAIDCPFDDYFDRLLEKNAKDAPPQESSRIGLRADPQDHGDEPDDRGGCSSLKPSNLLAAEPKTQEIKTIDDTSTEASPIPTPESSRPASPASHVIAAKIVPGARLSRKARKAAHASGPGSRDASANSRDKPEKAAGKVRRKWDNAGMIDDSDDKTLDYSGISIKQDDSAALASDAEAVPDSIPQSSWGRKTREGEFVLKDLDEELDSMLSSNSAKREQDKESSQSGGLVNSGLGAISGLFRNVVGGKTLTKDDLTKPLKAMEDHLINKNVARDAAFHLCSAVSKDLVGTKTPSFTTIDKTIRTSMDRALSQILTPTSGSSLDLLRAIQAVRSSSNPSARRPFVMSIVGVNGVGKSTTLAKLAFLLLHNNYRVLVAAADTFRSGAVEQLRVHVRNLQQLTARSTESTGLGHIDLYERGYGKDAAHIARDAVALAANPSKQSPDDEKPYDVVLIDTAGRRHNDTRLMSSLTPFAKAANPDKILMVGEALVGTDSVAQARHFNESFGAGRKLDGFIVSKCDTVGEMVGTLVSLVWSTGVPVVAVGVGQHYGDLRGFRVGWARHLLLEGT